MSTEVRSEIQGAINALQILDLRLSGNAELIPKEFAKFTDAQMAASAAQSVVAVYAAVSEAAS